MQRAIEFLNQHPDFEQISENIFSDGKNEFHVSILIEYVEAMIEAGHLRLTGTYENQSKTCLIHSTDMTGRCFICGEQVFENDKKCN